MTALFSSVVLQWWLRRILELGPLVSGALSWFLNQPPEVQQTLLAILQGNWATVTLGTIVTIGGYIWSFISTRRNQVTIDGQQVPLQQIPQKVAVEEIARTAILKRSRTLADLLAEKLGRR